MSQAVGITAAVTLGLTSYAMQTKRDFTAAGGILFSLLFALVMAGQWADASVCMVPMLQTTEAWAAHRCLCCMCNLCSAVGSHQFATANISTTTSCWRLCASVSAGILSMFVHTRVMNIVLAGVGAAIFSAYIVFDVQLIMGGGHAELSPDEYVVSG